MVLAARLREELGLPGLTVAQTVPFRDKERMKQLLDAAGLRTPRHDRRPDRRRACGPPPSASAIPLIVKPIDGAGSADTYRADSAADLDAILPDAPARAAGQRRGVRRRRGVHLRHHLRRRPGAVREHLPVPPAPAADQAARVDQPGHAGPARPGRARPAGRPRARRRRAAGARVPRRVHPHGVVPQGRRRGGVRRDRRPAAGRAHGRRDELRHRRRPVHRLGRRGHPGQIPQPVERRYNAASIFKRASGAGRITRYEGLDHLLAEYGEHVAAIDLLPVGAPRRDWRATLSPTAWSSSATRTWRRPWRWPSASPPTSTCYAG